LSKFEWAASLWQDLRYAARGIRKNPAFAALAIGTFALGIGANTAIFSVIDAVMLRPLPYPDSGKLVFLWSGDPQRSLQYSFSYPRFEMFRDHSDEFAGVAAYDDETVSFADRGEPERIEGGRVSKEFFSILGVSPALGRTFSPDEDRPGGAPVAMLSHRRWQEHYGSDPKVLGKTVRIDGEEYTIIGVLPAGFEFLGQPVEVWRCRLFDTRTYAPSSVRLGAAYITVVARLKHGVAFTQAQAKVALLDADYKRANPGHSDVGSSVHAGLLQEQVFAGIRLSLLVLWGAVSCLLLIACANVANLLLSRAMGRRQEITVRLAVGASRWRVARQLLTESVLISACGGLVGLPLAGWGTELLVEAMRQTAPQIPDVHLDAGVMLFTLAVSVMVGIAFGLAPVFYSLRGDLQSGLRSGGRGASNSASRGRFRGALVASEIALSLVLLTAAGLLAQSFVRMRSMRTGIETDRVWAMPLVLLPERYDRWETRTAFYDEALRRVGTLPGVIAAGITTRIDLLQFGLGYLTWIEGAPDLGPKNPGARGRSISPEYLQVMGIPLVRGRGFTTHDIATSARVMLVNESFARHFFPGQDPIGKRVTYSTDRITCQIVGVVRDVRSSLQTAESDEEMYLPLTQRPWLVARLVVRFAGNAGSAATAVRHEIQAIDPDQAAGALEPFDRFIERRLDQPRLMMLLVLVFAATALLLATVGIYGVMSYAVAQRAKEIGIRIALGAGSHNVRSMVIRQCMGLVMVGVLAGVPLAALMGRFYASLLFGVKAADPATFAGVATVLALVALAAGYVPAVRATRVDPIVVLRSE
jgi:putative ABC transport system permease protein